MKTREEHLEFCKQRAREYLDRGEAANAVTSMLSDLSKHPETTKVGEKLAMLGMFSCQDIEAARKFVEGFN